MAYGTILVHASQENGAWERLCLAARLARATQAHLVGCAATGVSRFLSLKTVGAGNQLVLVRCAALRREAAQALRRCELAARAEGLVSFETRLVDDDFAAALTAQARWADLVIAGRPERGVVAPPMVADLADMLVLECGRPVLVVPPDGARPLLDGTVTIAWDGGVPATRALDAALPLLRLAPDVLVLRYGAPAPERQADEDAQLSAWLGRHGVAVRFAHGAGGRHLGERILAHTQEAGASLLVMGAYGHPRWRESLMDGTTAAVLRLARLPVLLAH
jgi:nucleotide-binding universal stress UspA family protein